MDQGLTVRDGHDFPCAHRPVQYFRFLPRGASRRPLLEDLSAFRSLRRARGCDRAAARVSTHADVGLPVRCRDGLPLARTVPLTNGVVAGIFGVKHLAMLSGFVFFFHQLGSFFGGWLGGYLFDRTGSYQLVWLIAIGLSVISVVRESADRRAGA